MITYACSIHSGALVVLEGFAVDGHADCLTDDRPRIYSVHENDEPLVLPFILPADCLRFDTAIPWCAHCEQDGINMRYATRPAAAPEEGA